MSYQHKPGSGSLFNNDRKEKDTHPDFKGQAMLPDGTMVWLSAWRKESDRGDWFSVAIEPQQKREEQAPRQERSKAVPAPAASYDKPFDDEIGF